VAHRKRQLRRGVDVVNLVPNEAPPQLIVARTIKVHALDKVLIVDEGGGTMEMLPTSIVPAAQLHWLVHPRFLNHSGKNLSLGKLGPERRSISSSMSVLGGKALFFRFQIPLFHLRRTVSLDFAGQWTCFSLDFLGRDHDFHTAWITG
jgi:hypothetical protein